MLKPRTNFIGNALENRKTLSVIKIMSTIEICSISLKDFANKLSEYRNDMTYLKLIMLILKIQKPLPTGFVNIFLKWARIIHPEFRKQESLFVLI